MPNSKNPSNNRDSDKNTDSNTSARDNRTRRGPALPYAVAPKKEHTLIEAPQYTAEMPAYQQGSPTDPKLVSLESVVLDPPSSLPLRAAGTAQLTHPAQQQANIQNDVRSRTNRGEANTGRAKLGSVRPGKYALIFTTLYLGLLIASVFILSGRLYDWSFSRVLSNSPLALLEAPSNAISALDSIDTTTSLSAGNDFVRDSYSGLGFGGEAGTKTIRPINILLLGTDARPSDGDIARTDSIILLSVNPETHAIGMISMPRDLWVPIPSYDFTTKINVAYIIGEEENYPGGGAQLVMDTISSFIGRPIDYYARIDFEGFIEIIDQIGGIDVVIPKTIHDIEYPTQDYGVETFHLDAGQQHLDGDIALKYARTRNNDDDYARARRQQLVIQSSIDKIMSPGMIPTLLPKIPTLIQTMRSSIDTNIRTGMIFDLAKDTREGSLNIVRQLVLDSAYGEETYSEEGAWILLPNREKTRVALEDFFRVVQAPPTDGIVRSRADDVNLVRVEILNGTGQPRVAALTRELLQSKGWHVVSIDDADRSDYDNTLIVNYGAESALVEQIGGTLGLTDLPNLNLNRVASSKSTPVDIRIVVGRDILTVLQ